jgi:hypothetical protein
MVDNLTELFLTSRFTNSKRQYILREYGPAKESAQNARIEETGETLSPLSMQYTGDCSIAEPSGDRFLIPMIYGELRIVRITGKLPGVDA